MKRMPDTNEPVVGNDALGNDVLGLVDPEVEIQTLLSAIDRWAARSDPGRTGSDFSVVTMRRVAQAVRALAAERDALRKKLGTQERAATLCMPDATEPVAEKAVLGPVDPEAEKDIRVLLAATERWAAGLDPEREEDLSVLTPQRVVQALRVVVAERDALDAFLRRAVENLKTNPDGERWLYMCDAFLTDPETAKRLCLRYGLDPDERV